MRNYRAYGNFFKRGDHVYRKSAYLRWNDSEESLGSCLLLNPGSASLNRTDPLIYRELESSGKAEGQVAPDPTMDQIALFVERIYGGKPKGKVTIYNLFWLQNTDDQDAIEQYEKQSLQKEFAFDESLVSIKELQQHPWVLKGWGVKKHKKTWNHLGQIKNEWNSIIERANIPFFGKQHPTQKSGLYYYHPCPQIPTQRPSILNELQNIYLERMSR